MLPGKLMWTVERNFERCDYVELTGLEKKSEILEF